MTITSIPSSTVTFLFTDIEGSTKLARMEEFTIAQIRLEEQFERLERLVAEGQADGSAVDNPRRNQCAGESINVQEWRLCAHEL